MFTSFFCPGSVYIVLGVNDRELSAGKVGVGEKSGRGTGPDKVFGFLGFFTK